ncbi:hypothetical protein ScPMuIL_005855 [Solemya velum]
MAANYVFQIFVVVLAVAIVCANPKTCRKKFKECLGGGEHKDECKTQLLACYTNYCNQKFNRKISRRHAFTYAARAACYARYAIPVYLWPNE